MRKLFILIVISVILTYQSAAQITYGKEDCSDLFSKWIDKLNKAKEHMDYFRQFITAARKDITEGRFNVLRKTETQNLFLQSVINVLQNKSGGALGGDGFSAIVGFKDNIATTTAAFFENMETAGSPIQNFVHSLNFPFRVYAIDDEIKVSRAEKMYFLFDFKYDNKDFETFELNCFYKYLLDLVEYSRETPLENECLLFYEANAESLSFYTGLKAPPVTETENVKKYLKFFSNELLYAFGRYIEYMVNEKKVKSPVTLPAYKGTMGDNRYAIDYYTKLLSRNYIASIDRIIQHIHQLKNNNCAPLSSAKAGKVIIETSMEAIPQQPVADIKIPEMEIKPGLGRLLIIHKDPAGKYYRDVQGMLYYTEGKKDWYASPFVNSYAELNPGRYLFRCSHPAHDSMLVDVVVGDTRIVTLPDKGSLSAKLIDNIEGEEKPLTGIRIELLRPNKTIAYKTDTIFFDLIHGQRTSVMNAGLYRVGLRLPPKYYPAFIYREDPVEVQEHTNTLVTISGFGALNMKTFDGTGKPKNVRVDLFTPERNSKTNEYTWLVTTAGQDTVYLKPGRYRVKADYAFPIIREVEIVSGNVKEETIDNLGSLLVTNGSPTQEWVEITDDFNGRKTSVRNNTTIDLETDRTYTIKVIRFNNEPARYERGVQVQPGRLTTFNWKN